MSRPRLGSLADQLTAFRKYISRPETVQPGTNWSIIPSADNPRQPGTSIEPEFEITPSIPAIMAAMGAVDMVHRRQSSVLPGSAPLVRRHLEGRIIGGDVERDDRSRIVRIGRLRFANGDEDPAIADFEQVMIKGEGDEATLQNVRARTGTILGQRERSRVDDPAPSRVTNAKAANHVKAETPKHRKLTKARMAKLETTREAAGRLLREFGVDGTVGYEAARAAAGLAPQAKPQSPAMPSGAASVGPIFLAMDVRAPSSSGLEAWADLHVAMREAEAWRRVEAALSEDTKETVAAAQTARSLSDVSPKERIGGTQSRIRGRRALIAANDNLDAAIKKYVA